jgi:eukaryotic-like serine/threonine-protein kinase
MRGNGHGIQRSYQRLANYKTPDKPDRTLPGHRAPSGPIALAWDRASWWMHYHRRLIGTASAGTIAIAAIGGIAIARPNTGAPARPPTTASPAEGGSLPPLVLPKPSATPPRRAGPAPAKSPSPVRTKTETVTPSAKPSRSPGKPSPTGSGQPPGPILTDLDPGPSTSPTRTATPDTGDAG